MAGEIEEPIRLDFQAGSFHSGSISFGRFETENLCWERRSSFSHNRYLEDVEKCSKPGLVVEKKAYFEAHFRKKGILRLSSPESPNEYQPTENDVVEKTGHDDEINHSDTVNGTSSTCDITDNTDCLSDHAKIGSVLEIEVKRNLDGDESNINYTSRMSTVGLFSDDHATEGNDDASAISQQVPSPKEKIRSQVENTKHGSAPRVSVGQSKIHISNKSSKGSELKNNKTVNNVLMSSEAESKTTVTDAKDKRQMCKTPKNECGSKAKGDNDIKRNEKISRNRRIDEPRSFTIRNVSSVVHQRENRIISAVRTPQLCVKQDNSRLRFKSNERAERREESEGKTHAKEAKMNQLQSRTQEKTVAEIKQLRKSLNFKATPLPSFYRDSDRKKVTISDAKPQKIRTNSASRSRVSESSRLSCAAGKTKSSVPQTSTSCHSTVTSDSTPSSPSAVFSKDRPSQAGINSQQKLEGAEVKQTINSGKMDDNNQKKKPERTIHAAFTNGTRTGHKTVVVA